MLAAEASGQFTYVPEVSPEENGTDEPMEDAPEELTPSRVSIIKHLWIPSGMAV